MTLFDDVTTWQPVEGASGRFAGRVPDDWMQGRAAFGGLLTTGCVRLAARQEPDRAIRTVEARFFEPVGVGALEARVEVLRAGRSVAHVQVEVWQEARRCMRAVVCLAAPRPSDLEVPAPTAPDPAGGPTARSELPYVPGLMPVFTQHTDMRFLSGMPYSGAKDAVIDGWCRFRVGASGLAAVVGLVDVWPAPLLARTTRPAPASTVHWSLHLYCDDPDLDATAWYRYRARTLRAGDGMSTFEASLWDADGRPICWSEQLAAVFDRRE